MYHGKVKRYKATQGHDAYQAHRKNCGRKSDFLRKTQFMRYVHKHFFKDSWSLDVCSNRATAAGEFGHWECDLVLGHKTKDDEVLLTLSERMSREFLIIRISDKTSVSVMQAFKEL